MTKHAYAARKPCGCLVAAILEDHEWRRDTAHEVAAWITHAWTVERLPLDVVRAQLAPCTCPVTHTTAEYRIALRPDDDGYLDDVVVRDVAMFRAEDMGDWWWVCCYLAGEDKGNCIAWHIAVDRKAPNPGGAKGRRVVMTTTEYPTGVVYEDGSPTSLPRREGAG